MNSKENTMGKKLAGKAMEEISASKGIDNGRQHGQQKEERNSKLPKKTNTNLVPK